MHTIEQAIRHALQKIDTSSPTLRNKLYQTTWQTHEKMLASLAQISAEEKQKRREALKDVIQAIEAEFYQQAAPAKAPAPSPPLERFPKSGKQVSDKKRDEIPELEQVPITAPDLIPPKRFENERDKTVGKRRMNLRGNGLLLLLVVILLFVAWSFYNSLIGSNDATDSSQPAASDQISSLITQAEAESGTASPRPEGQVRARERRWIRIFDPVNIENVRIKGAARVQLYEDEAGSFLRLQTSDIEEAISLDIGEGIMAQLKGKSAIFNIIARGATDGVAQLSVACDFGTAATCGRWRFELPPAREDLLFGVDIPDQIQPRSSATLVLSVSGDVRDREYAVDIFGLEVSFDE